MIVTFWWPPRLLGRRRPCYVCGVDARVGEALAKTATAWSVPFDDSKADALQRFASLLMTWTARINLTGASSADALADEHLPDSFALASRLSPAELGAEAARVVDVGSGGGLPAIPLAVLCPHLQLELFEPVAKKTAFLRTAVRELGIGERVKVTAKRAETRVPGDFDVAISRATLPPPAWIALAEQLVHPGGRIFVLASDGSDPGSPPPPLLSIGRWSYQDGRRALIELRRPPGSGQ
jgi:16S rRNA (guanine527-N7)-methyltransferase